MDLLQTMQLFVHSVDLGSFSKAAQAHKLKASSVSRHISSLEQSLGTILLRRSTRELLLTDAGASFYERATRILADIEDAKRTTMAAAAEPIGTLRVRAPVEFGRIQISSMIPEFMAAMPGLSFDVTLSDLEMDPESARFDVSIRFGEPSDTRFYAQKLASNRYAIVCSPAYLAREAEPKFPSALCNYNCMTHADLDTWKFGSTRSTVEIAVTVTGSFRCNRQEPILQATLAGAGFARLPLWLAGPYLKSKALTPVLTNYEVTCSDSSIYYMYAERRAASPKVRTFLEFLARKIDTPPNWEP